MVNINYEVEGNGEAIVLIHGLSDNLLYWEALASILKKDYKIIRYDLRGHGQSELGDEEISIDLFSEDLKGLLENLNIEKAHLVGFSLGAMVAIDFTVKHPLKVSSLVLMSGVSKLNSRSKDVLNKFSQAIDNSFEEFYDFILPLVLCPDVIENNKSELEMIKEISSPAANTEAIKKAISAALMFNQEDNLDKINVPSLILAGKYDEIFLVSEQKKSLEKIKNSELIILDNVRHNLLVGKNISAVADILNDFF